MFLSIYLYSREQAYEGLKTADKLKEEYLFIPAKVKEVYLSYLLNMLKELKVRSAIIFASTCKGCHLLSLILEELGLPCASLHSGKNLGGNCIENSLISWNPLNQHHDLQGNPRNNELQH